MNGSKDHSLNIPQNFTTTAVQFNKLQTNIYKANPFVVGT